MKLRRLSAFFLCLLLLGCGSTATEESENGGDNPAKDDKMTVHVKSWDETQTLVAGKKGKVVVIDLWHLW